MAEIQLHSPGWQVRSTVAAVRSGRRSAALVSTFPSEFLTDSSFIADEFVAEPKPAVRRGLAPESALDFSYPLAEDEAAILAIRYPSGALTFHLPAESTRRGTGKSGQARFMVTVRSVDVETGRRGIITKAIKATLIKVGKVVLDNVTSFVLPKLAAKFEQSAWEKKELQEGWLKVTPDTLRNGKLERSTPSSTDRTLLFIHGTFSHAASAFGPLASSKFFERVAALYGDRMYAKKTSECCWRRYPTRPSPSTLSPIPAGDWY